MTEDERWHLLKDWLRRDLWTKTQACYIYALLIRIEKGDPFEENHSVEIKTILNISLASLMACIIIQIKLNMANETFCKYRFNCSVLCHI